EIDRDASAGLTGPGEADAARVEISRRLLSAADFSRDRPMQSNTRLRRAAAVGGLGGLPLLGVAIYLPLGSPLLADFPLSARAHTPDTGPSLEGLFAHVAQNPVKKPTDGRRLAL